MDVITLEAVDNQSFTFTGDSQRYLINLRTIDDTLYMDVTMNGASIISGAQCLPGQMVVPYAYLEGDGGNFIFNTTSGNNPQAANFGSSDTLLYVTAAEMAVARADNASAVTAITLTSSQAA